MSGAISPERLRDMRWVCEDYVRDHDSLPMNAEGIWQGTVLELLNERDALAQKVEEFNPLFELQARQFKEVTEKLEASEARVKELEEVFEHQRQARRASR